MATMKVKDIKVQCAPRLAWTLCLEYFGESGEGEAAGWSLSHVDERNATITAGKSPTGGERMGAFLRGGATGIGLIKAARVKGMQLTLQLEPGGVLDPNATFIRAASEKKGAFDPGSANGRSLDEFEAWLRRRVEAAMDSGEATGAQWRPGV